MKRVGNLYKSMISDFNIELAIDEVNRGHRWFGNHKPNKTVMWVETTKPERIKELRAIIENGFEPVKPVIKRRYDCNAKKWRDIAEPRLYPDQYIHHILIQAIEPILMRGMDRYCCGSVKGRGTIYGVKRIKSWIKKNNNKTRWCAELDIYHFYEQLQPNIVMNRMKHLIKDYRVLNLIERVMRYGVTIGAYFSQWFANTVLQPLDQLIHTIYGVTHYLRYMDNFTIFAQDRYTLRRVIQCMKEWLEKHKMRLKPTYQYFKTECRLVNALGYRYADNYVLIRKSRLLGIKRQMKSYYRQHGTITSRFAHSLLSRIGGLTHCNRISIYARFIPNGIQKKLKNIIRTTQRREYTEWNMCLAQYLLTV